jgi:glycosyltransferase involved in cell wall biosynthesis
MRPMRVVMIYIEPTPYVMGLIDALRRSWDGPIEALYITTDSSQAWKLKVNGAQERVLPPRFLTRMAAIWSALRGGRDRSILHLAGWGHSVLLGALLMGRLLRIPVIVESDTGAGRADHTWRGVVKKLLYAWLFRLPHRFLPGGTRQVRYLAEFGVTKDRMTVAQMTVDVEAIRRFCAENREAERSATRARWGLSVEEAVALYVGRLEEDKGVDLLLAAFAGAAAQYENLRLVIAGDGSLRGRVNAGAAADRRIVYLGRLSGDDVLRAYVAADFLVLPSRFEPWGLVVNEAMGCGLPVILSDRVGCADDLVRGRETGLVVAAGDEAALAAAMVRLARDEAPRRPMGQAAEKLISSWTLGNEARNVISAWEAIAR